MDEIDGVEVVTAPDAGAWQRWLAAHHADRPAVWLRLAKKSGGATSVTRGEALDGALAYGWIDSQSKSQDADYSLQRYSPRRRRSPWSAINVEKADALIAAGLMQPAGQAEVDAAKADGRWAAAYASQSTAEPPPALLTALAERPTARARFEAMTRSDRYTLMLPLLKATTDATKAARLKALLTLLDE